VVCHARLFLIKEKKEQVKIATVSTGRRESISEFMEENKYFPIARSTMTYGGIMLSFQMIHQLFVWVKLQGQN